MKKQQKKRDNKNTHSRPSLPQKYRQLGKKIKTGIVYHIPYHKSLIFRILYIMSINRGVMSNLNVFSFFPLTLEISPSVLKKEKKGQKKKRKSLDHDQK